MKKIILYSLFGLLFALAGCVQDNILQAEPQVPENGEVTVKFKVSIPEFKTVQTRATGGVNDMWLLVFDQNQNFLARKPATLQNQTENGGEFTVTLPASGYKRYIHFVSNYDWTGFNDLDVLGYNAIGMMNVLSTQNPGFWTMVELPDGINVNSFTGPGAPEVKLLRNQAKISVAETADNFELSGFAIHKAPERGTMSPFNPVSATFEIGYITEPAGVTLLDAQETNISSAEKLLFERKNKNATEITTVIVKGIYNNNTYFYKIDLINDQKVRYDIERNYHYKINITDVSKEGYINFSDALAGASHNNTALDPIIEKYPLISDGTSKLEVEKTLVILTQPDQPVNIWYRFFPDASSTNVDNSGVSVSLIQNDGAIADGSFSYDNATGIITATGASTIPANPVEARFMVNQSDLARTVRVVLRSPFSFNPVTINDRSPATLETGQEVAATLRFYIPNDFPDELFPLPVNIYTQGLYPATAGLQMFVEQGVIRYVYIASSKGVQPVYFKTNKSGNAETVTLKADYFTDGTVAYRTSYTGNIQFAGNSLPSGSAVTASVGSLQISSDGFYRYTPPANPNMDTPVTLTYEHEIASNTNGGIAQSIHERYVVSTTIGDLFNGASLNMTLDSYRVTGRIRYTTRTNNYLALTSVPSGATLTITGTVTGVTASMLATERYQLIIPATNAESATVRVNYTTDGNTYWSEQSINTYRTTQYLRLRTVGP